jgi:cystathionine beta-lyase/cystathionine gamma-synthase
VKGSSEFTYLAALTAGLAAEIEPWQERVPGLQELDADLERLRKVLECSPEAADLENLQRHWQCYRSLVHRKAAALNQASSIARSYESMEDFWADAAAQEKGLSADTFWDTYENGRRRQLELQFARAYGVPAALLVNCGMSALAVTTGALLRPGSVLLTGRHSYFETVEYVDEILTPAGVSVVRVPVQEPGAIVTALQQHKPQVALFETVTNGPEVEIPADIERWHTAGPDTLFVIDNSSQSHLCRWFDVVPSLAPWMLIIESAVKYLTHECMAGVVYGTSELVERARGNARGTGQQLQQRAFNYLCTAEVECVGLKLSLHSRNVRRFRAELASGSELFEFVRPLDGGGAGGEIFRQGVGALVFIRLREAMVGEREEDIARLHRELLRRWRGECLAIGLNLFVRAGFGWNETSARVYESRQLNRADAPTYLRVSVGIEPEHVISTFARILVNAAQEVIVDQESYAGLV